MNVHEGTDSVQAALVDRSAQLSLITLLAAAMVIASSVTAFWPTAIRRDQAEPRLRQSGECEKDEGRCEKRFFNS